MIKVGKDSIIEVAKAIAASQEQYPRKWEQLSVLERSLAYTMAKAAMGSILTSFIELTYDVVKVREERDDFRTEVMALENKADACLDHLKVIQKIITEGAMTGFIPTEGDWAERLFESQQGTSALTKYNGGADET